MKTKNEKHTEFLRAYFIGLVVSFFICLLGVWILAQLTLLERAGEGSAYLAVPVILMVATFLGSQVNISLQKRYVKYAPIRFAVVFAILLLITGLMQDGVFRMVEFNLISIGVGGVISYLICLKKGANTRMKKRHYR